LTKHQTNKQKKGNPSKRWFPWYLWIVIGIAICLVFTLIVVTNPFTPTSPVQTDVLKCAIVDQLYSVSPNPAFIESVTNQLESAGFSVDLYKTDEVTVDFYRQLPSHGYKLIIFRVHAGLLENDKEGIGKKIWLFTSEPYSRMRYYIAQLRDQVTAAKTTVSDDPVFALSAKFVTDCMRHNFANTIIINMGCSAFNSDEMAKAYTKRGASAYMAWDVSVGLNYVDDATMTLVRKLCSQELTVAQAVTETIEEKGPDPNNHAYLKYYPQTSADKTIKQLIE
jgi:hypothetical protein